MESQVLKHIVEIAPKYLSDKEVIKLRKQLLVIYLNEQIAQLESSSKKSVFIPEQNLYRASTDQIKILRKQLEGLK